LEDHCLGQPRHKHETLFKTFLQQKGLEVWLKWYTQGPEFKIPAPLKKKRKKVSDLKVHHRKKATA
jgi:hypothetical protein